MKYTNSIPEFPQTRVALLSWHRLYRDLSRESLKIGRRAEAAYFLDMAASQRISLEYRKTQHEQAALDAIADHRTERQFQMMEGCHE